LENGYRYYDASQLSDLVQIERLKRYGFSLNEIRELLLLPQDALAQRIHVRMLEAYRELNEMRKTLRRMEDDLLRMEESEYMRQDYKVIVMDTPAQRVFGIRRRINIGEIHDLFQELKREMEKKGIRRAGAAQLLYHDEEFSHESMDVEAQFQVAGSQDGITDVPAQLCAATTHTGPYEEIHAAYSAIGSWMAQHPEYRICGAVIERYLKDEGTVSSPEEYETGVLFPIEKTGK
jgi:effector-binding domain-containing protein